MCIVDNQIIIVFVMELKVKMVSMTTMCTIELRFEMYLLTNG